VWLQELILLGATAIEDKLQVVNGFRKIVWLTLRETIWTLIYIVWTTVPAGRQHGVSLS
jgi:hypothetical protein